MSMAKTFNVKLAGVSHKNDDGTDRQIYIERFAQAGMPLTLKPEPDNRFDPNAVSVWIEDCRRLQKMQIGFLDARLAGEVTRLIKRGGTASAHIVEVVGGSREMPTRGVVIEMTKREPGEPCPDLAPINPLPVRQTTTKTRKPSTLATTFGAALGRLLGRMIK